MNVFHVAFVFQNALIKQFQKAIIPDPAHKKNKEELLEKKKRIHVE